MEISYAGVGLTLPTPELAAWLDRYLPLLDTRDIQPPSRWPGANLNRLTWVDPPDYPCQRVSQLFWPCGAARWAVGRFLTTGDNLKKIRDKVAPSGNYKADDLILDVQPEKDNAGGQQQIGTQSKVIKAKMWLLPPRPLAGFLANIEQTGAENDLYLLTLVDERYWWQWQGTTITESMSWQSAANKGPVSVDLGMVDPDHFALEPDSGLYLNKENAALALEAVLYNVGRGLVVKFDGAYSAQTWEAARDSAKAERKLWLPVSGGAPLNPDLTLTDLAPFRRVVVPERVTVTFPPWIDGRGHYEPIQNFRSWPQSSYHLTYPIEVLTNSLPGYSQYVGSTAFKPILHTTAKAIYDDETDAEGLGPPSNDADLQKLAKRMAKDLIEHQLARLDEVYAGLVPWSNDAANDVTFICRPDLMLTRVQGRPFNSYPREFCHGTGPLASQEDSEDRRWVVRVTGPLEFGSSIYPAVVLDYTGGGFADSSTVIGLIQINGYALQTNGTGRYHAHPIPNNPGLWGTSARLC